jgi:hypothetical protein
MRKLGRYRMERIYLNDDEIKKLRELIDKDKEPRLYRKIKISKSRRKHLRNARKLRKILHQVEKEKEEAPIIETQPVTEVKPCVEIESITIDMIKMLKGRERERTLKAYHEWKARQKAIDIQYSKREKGRVDRMRAIRKDPEGFKARCRRYHLEERERLHNSPEWIKAHNTPRKVQTPEERMAKRRAWYEYCRDNPVMAAKIKEQKRQAYYDKHKDEPGWLEARARREERARNIDQLLGDRAKRKAERELRKLQHHEKRVWTDEQKQLVLQLLDVEHLSVSDIRERMGLTRREIRSVYSSAKYSSDAQVARRARARELYLLNSTNPDIVAKRREKDKLKYARHKEERSAYAKALYNLKKTDPEWVAVQKAKLEQNRDKLRERGKQYYINNKAKIRARMERNKDKIKEHSKTYYQLNRNRILAQKANRRLK